MLTHGLEGEASFRFLDDELVLRQEGFLHLVGWCHSMDLTSAKVARQAKEQKDYVQDARATEGAPAFYSKQPEPSLYTHTTPFAPPGPAASDPTSPVHPTDSYSSTCTILLPNI